MKEPAWCVRGLAVGGGGIGGDIDGSGGGGPREALRCSEAEFVLSEILNIFALCLISPTLA